MARRNTDGWARRARVLYEGRGGLRTSDPAIRDYEDDRTPCIIFSVDLSLLIQKILSKWVTD